MKNVISFLGEVRLELTKVTWPKKEEVFRLTMVVFVISGAVALYVSALDVGFTKLLEFTINR